MNAQLEFLKHVWHLITGHRTGTYQSSWISNFVSESIAEKLPYYISTSELIKLCNSRAEIEASFARAVYHLQADWNLLAPEFKRELLTNAQTWAIADFLTESKYQLTPNDVDYLAIRWDLAESIYQRYKRGAFNKMRTYGIDIETRELTSKLENFEEAVRCARQDIYDLVRFRADVSFAAVVAQGKSASKFRRKILDETYFEFVLLLDEFRKLIFSVLKEFVTVPPEFKDRYNKAEIETMVIDKARLDTENRLEPLSAMYDKLSAGFDAIVPSADLIVEIKEMTGEAPMSITITGDGNVVGNDNVVITTINKGIIGKSRDLADAFGLFKAEVLKLQIDEKLKKQAVRAIEDAEDEVADKKTDADSVENSLKRVKDVLEKSGAVFDQVEGWGVRLIGVAQKIIEIIPANWYWLSTFVS
jgi:hypothetical protein